MSQQNKKMQLLGNAPIPQALLAMGIPTMIGMLVNALYNLVDAYFVGGLGESQMGAISVVYPLGQVVVGLGLLFGNGAASYISRLLGRNDKEKANQVVSTALYSSVFVGAVMIILSVIFLKPILSILGATESILPYAVTYGSIYIISCIFNVFNVTMNNIVTSEGAAKTTMCALLIGAVLNIALDPIFIYVLDLGVAGAAIATAISQVVSTLVYLFYIFGKKSVFDFKIKNYCLSKEVASEIFKIGIPTLVFQILTSLSISLINNAAADYGDAAIAGMGVVTRLVSMGSLTIFGFIKGKWNFSHAVWLLYRIFLIIPCFRKRERRLYSRSLQAGNLLCASYSRSAYDMGIEWYSVCSASCRCAFCYYYGIYGYPSSQRIK